MESGKMKFRVDELISILVKSEVSLLEKYKIDRVELQKLHKNMKDGKWRFIK